MQRFYKVLTAPRFREYLDRINEHETRRKFCRHDEQHLLDTARLAWILVLEKRLDFSRELVYTAAFLHDIGRWCEYEDAKKDHAVISAVLARPLLQAAGFTIAEIEIITLAIAEHRLLPQKCSSPLGRILATADDLSRRCFACGVSAECHKYRRMPARDQPVY